MASSEAMVTISPKRATCVRSQERGTETLNSAQEARRASVQQTPFEDESSATQSFAMSNDSTMNHISTTANKIAEILGINGSRDKLIKLQGRETKKPFLL